MQDTSPADFESWFSFDCAQNSKGCHRAIFFAKTCVLLTLKEEQLVQLGVTFSVKVENEDK